MNFSPRCVALQRSTRNHHIIKSICHVQPMFDNSTNTWMAMVFQDPLECSTWVHLFNSSNSTTWRIFLFLHFTAVGIDSLRLSALSTPWELGWLRNGLLPASGSPCALAPSLEISSNGRIRSLSWFQESFSQNTQVPQFSLVSRNVFPKCFVWPYQLCHVAVLAPRTLWPPRMMSGSVIYYVIQRRWFAWHLIVNGLMGEEPNGDKLQRLRPNSEDLL